GGGAPAITGRVLGPRGAPLPGAEVEAVLRPFAGFDVRAEELARAAEVVARGSTGADGSFRLDVPADLALSVRAGAPGLGRELRQDAFAGDSVELELAEAGTLDVRVRRDGEACARALLELTRQGVPGSAWSGTTDASGHATASGLARGIYTLD